MTEERERTYGHHAGSFAIHKGRCEIYCRKNWITMFFAKDNGDIGAFHMPVADGYEAGRALLQAAETTPYDEVRVEGAAP